MGILRGIGRAFWRFMVIFSFIVNIVLVVVVVVLLLLIFDIKNNIASPLVQGLHSSFVGLDQATIDWTIPVRDEIPVRLNIPLETNTVVTLTRGVPLAVYANINAPSLTMTNALVQLTLPAGLELPVALNLDVVVDQPLPVALDVRAVIPLKETQLHDVATSLRLLLEPMAVALDNLPSDFNGAGQLVGDILGGNPPNLLEANQYSLNPWPGFSRTAGQNYELVNVPTPWENRPIETGIVPVGGVPALDEQVRPWLYANNSSPHLNNEAARQQMAAQGVSPVFFNGQFAAFRASSVAAAAADTQQAGGIAEPTPTTP
jgi:hypothetical protein